MDFQRWKQLMQRLQLPPNKNTFDALLKSYSEPHRHYHNPIHIDATLKQLDCVQYLAEQPDEIELALWFHDAIYNPVSSSNELDSADWAAGFLKQHAVIQDRIDRVHNLIMATLHCASLKQADETLMVDIDLTILGSPESAYEQFECNVREEYKWVPEPLYKAKRKEILQGFVDRERIYHTDYFHNHLEVRARQNLNKAIRNLS
ncbi:hypothetical protein FT643_17050 [Ketobacter sp. MCCC 1A13808]|uniref:HD domain-containing protein n=1 Tax=Ketobacter sp. MCCC 1A13808 TaxID=2602738 RepID=UPI0012EC2D77|nr:hypothetical protein [Ketobacter sp. MCCC 1A13808]MVF13851.1 hypothetical protein [Ketobacter sp. MCCC 1A13808]